jgi:hypothetical protein
MQEYLFFIGLLSVVYLAYLTTRVREKKQMKRYYGYRSRQREESRVRKAA